MTHNELLTKIDNYTCCSDDYTCCSGVYGLVLKAVVELHEPINSIRGIVCRHCFTDALHRTEFYPCPTIQTIEKELR